MMLFRLHGFDYCLLLGDGAGQRLLTIHILFPFRRFRGYERVPMIRHGDHHRVNVVPCHHFAIVVIRLAILVPVMGVDRVDGRLQVALVQVARCDNLAIILCQERLGVAGPIMPQPMTPRVMRFEAGGRAAPQALAGRIDTAPAALRKSRRVKQERELDGKFFIIVTLDFSSARQVQPRTLILNGNLNINRN